ncbi:hypothetical protein AB0C38_37580 [Amycolatopsis sp. NPDC048633]|uniref:oxidoreductase n=1 Tax=Amycolatopsis sp. NPDC048633 TaxID=3157095 RepID=UPI0033CAC5FE
MHTASGRRPTVTPRELSDGVEVAANGVYLLAQFLHPRMNRRTDAYGRCWRKLLLEVVDAVCASGIAVGVRLSPWWTGGLFTVDEALRAEYDELVAGLDVSYLHLRGPDAGPDFAGFARYRRLFGGSLIVNNGFDRASGDAVIEAGIADAVSYSRHFVANPDLVTRFALGWPLEPADPATYYGGGAAGYVEQAAAIAAVSQ